MRRPVGSGLTRCRRRRQSPRRAGSPRYGAALYSGIDDCGAIYREPARHDALHWRTTYGSITSD